MFDLRPAAITSLALKIDRSIPLAQTFIDPVHKDELTILRFPPVRNVKTDPFIAVVIRAGARTEMPGDARPACVYVLDDILGVQSPFWMSPDWIQYQAKTGRALVENANLHVQRALSEVIGNRDADTFDTPLSLISSTFGLVARSSIELPYLILARDWLVEKIGGNAGHLLQNDLLRGLECKGEELASYEKLSNKDKVFCLVWCPRSPLNAASQIELPESLRRHLAAERPALDDFGPYLTAIANLFQPDFFSTSVERCLVTLEEEHKWIIVMSLCVSICEGQEPLTRHAEKILKIPINADVIAVVERNLEDTILTLNLEPVVNYFSLGLTKLKLGKVDEAKTFIGRLNDIHQPTLATILSAFCNRKS